MSSAIILALTVAILGLGIGLAIRGGARRDGESSARRARRVAIIQACALLMCSAFLTTNAITTDRLRYVNISVAVLTGVYGVIQLWRLRRDREESAS
jgi:Ca2+/H+ antiporter